MPKAVCPACGERIRIEEDNALLFSRFRCPECGALLEVFEKDPLQLEEISEEDEEKDDEDVYYEGEGA